MFGISNGISALSAARLAIQTVGNNLANATTPGYSRQRVVNQTGTPTLVGRFYQGGGVRVGSLDRVTDDLLLSRVRNQTQEVARRNISLETLLGVEAAFGEPSETAFSGQLTTFFGSLSALATSPDDNVQKKGAIFAGVDIAEQLRRIRGDLANTQGGVNELVEATTDKVNALAESIAAVNDEIANTQGFSGGPPAALLDRQGQLIDEMSQYVDVDVQAAGAGRLDVRVGGQMIVSFGGVNKLSASRNSDGGLSVALEGSAYEVEVTSGELRGYLDLSKSGVGERVNELDELASAMILNFNRVHSTGVPAGGGFTSLQSSYQVSDTDGNGILGDSLIRDAGLPFAAQSGRLWVSVIDDATGAISQTSIDIDPNSDTVQSFVDKLGAINGLSATLDATGRVNINAQPGQRFHFGSTLNTNPNPAGTFGSDSGQILGSSSEPYALSVGDSLSVSVDGGPPQAVTFNSGQFNKIGSASASEVAAVLQSSLVGATASVQDGKIIITSNSTGTASQIQVTDGTGSPASAFGLSIVTDFGGALGVNVTVGGEYTGSQDENLNFRPIGTGTIGLTSGLQVEALNSQGQVVAILDVGKGYSPGKELEVFDGITISFGPGEISQEAGDYVELPVFADGDDSDVLAAFGLNAFFQGSDATDIDIASSLKDSPDNLALALGGSPSDNRNILRLLNLRDGALGELGDRSAEEFYNGIVAQVGTNTNRAALNLETETLLKESFENRLESVRGVSIDEELADLQRYEQAYQAAARYVTAINEMTQVLFNL